MSLSMATGGGLHQPFARGYPCVSAAHTERTGHFLPNRSPSPTSGANLGQGVDSIACESGNRRRRFVDACQRIRRRSPVAHGIFLYRARSASCGRRPVSSLSRSAGIFFSKAPDDKDLGRWRRQEAAFFLHRNKRSCPVFTGRGQKQPAGAGLERQSASRSRPCRKRYRPKVPPSLQAGRRIPRNGWGPGIRHSPAGPRCRFAEHEPAQPAARQMDPPKLNHEAGARACGKGVEHRE